MKILIFGYTGYIGMEVYNKLAKSNFYLKGVSRNKFSKFKNHINYDFFKKKNNIKQIVEEFDVIINCFGEVRRENLMRKTHVIEHEKIVKSISFFAKKNAKKIHWIQISTLGVYGFDGMAPIYQKIDDKTPTNPLSLYEKTKLASEIILKNHSNKFFKYTILRVGTVISKVSRQTLFDRIIYLMNKNICIFIETKNTIFNIIYLDDLANIISKCIFNPKTFKKTYIVATNIKLKNIYQYFKKRKLFVLKFVLSKEEIKKIIFFINIFKIKKIKFHKFNFFLYRRRVSMKSILRDIKYELKFNLYSILKKRFQ